MPKMELDKDMLLVQLGVGAASGHCSRFANCPAGLLPTLLQKTKDWKKAAEKWHYHLENSFLQRTHKRDLAGGLINSSLQTQMLKFLDELVELGV